jgi:hypothetical protein
LVKPSRIRFRVPRPVVLGVLLGALAGVCPAGPVAPAAAVITGARAVAGPSPAILGIGNVSMAPDGTGGVVWRQLFDGAAHIFVSQFDGGSWSAPIQVDAGQPGPSTFPAVAAGDGGELLVVWVQPWASESTGGNPPATVDQLMSAVLQPGARMFGPAIQVDPGDVGDGTGVFPMLAMAPNGNAYVVYRVIVSPLDPSTNEAANVGVSPLRAGDELVDVRVAHFNGLFWSSLRAVNEFENTSTNLPAISMRPPTSANAPSIAVDTAGNALVAWQEPTIDGVDRIWARRLFGTTQGSGLEASPATLDAQPVTEDADAPAAGLNADGGAAVAFRLAGRVSSTVSSPQMLVNTMNSTQAPDAAGFNGALSLGGASTLGQPSVAIDDQGRFQVGFTAGPAAELARGTGDATTGTPAPIGSASGTLALTTLDPDGGGAAAWPSTNSIGAPDVEVRETFPSGGYQTASLSAPMTGPIGSVTFGPSGQGDALIAFQQGDGSTTQIAAADVQAPPHAFQAYTPGTWVTPRRTLVTWDPASNAIGPVVYSLSVDGQIRKSGLRGLRYRLHPGQIGTGRFQVRVIATDDAGQQIVSPETDLKVDGTPPLVSLRALPGHRARIHVHDPDSGADPGRVAISFGDGTRPVRGRLTIIHAYRRGGRFRISVRCADNLGNHAVYHLWVHA